MTVKDVFDLRRQGRVEEAYEAIRPMYAVHKGKYTTLAMFWVGSDILKKRLSEGRKEEALAVFKALIRLYPHADDSDGRCRSAMLGHLLRMAEATAEVSVLHYLAAFPIMDADWLSQTTQQGFLIESVALRLLERILKELQREPTVDNALLAVPFLKQALAHDRRQQTCLYCMALVYRIMGEEEKAEAVLPKTSSGVPLPFDEHRTETV